MKKLILVCLLVTHGFSFYAVGQNVICDALNRSIVKTNDKIKEYDINKDKKSTFDYITIAKTYHITMSKQCNHDNANIEIAKLDSIKYDIEHQ